MKKSRCIFLQGGEMISHGDKVYATLMQNDEPVDVVGTLCINEDDSSGRKHYICQDDCDGDSAAEEKFGYRYSWSFTVDDNGVIGTSDTTYVSKRPKPVEKDEDEEDVDDDPMPDDWVNSEELPF